MIARLIGEDSIQVEDGGENGWRRAEKSAPNPRKSRLSRLTLDDTDDKTTMNDELSQFCTSFVRVTTMPNEKFRQIAELIDGEIGSKGSLSTFFSDNADTYRKQARGVSVSCERGEGKADSPTSAA